jgi:phytoene dehydrogenase-like protein
MGRNLAGYVGIWEISPRIPRSRLLGLVRANALQHAPFLMKPLAAVIAAANLPTPIAEAVAIWTHVAGQTTGQAPSPLAFVPALMHSAGAYYPEGGIGRIPQVLEKASADAGVRFRYSTRVIGIRCENGRTIGVETSSGEFMPAAVVLSNSAALGTYLQLLDPPPAHVDSLKKLPLQFPGVCAYLAVRGRVAPPYLQFKLAAPDEKCRLLVRPAIVDPHTHKAEWTPVRLLAPQGLCRGPAGRAPGPIELP